MRQQTMETMETKELKEKHFGSREDAIKQKLSRQSQYNTWHVIESKVARDEEGKWYYKVKIGKFR